jgi:hypothetical protein
MAISINYPDKVVAGVWQSFTIASDEGAPDGEVLVDGKPVERKILTLRPPLYKVTFLLSADTVGKSLGLKLRNESHKLEETKAIEAG